MGAGINIVHTIDTVYATISGTGTYTSSVNGTLYKYTFTSGTNNISFNRNISSMNVIAVGIGGNGGYGRSGSAGGGSGGAGGGFGVWNFAYTIDGLYNIEIGSPTSFLSNGIGVSASKGANGNLTNTPVSGTFTKSGTSTGGTITTRTGGNGGSGSAGNGGNSSGSITVLGIDYNYGGGGRAGSDNTNRTGGNPGVSGSGATASNGTNHGENATTPGSGGGGGSVAGDTSTNWGGTGGPGLIIITFYYP
jgi:hypothetical protein